MPPETEMRVTVKAEDGSVLFDRSDERNEVAWIVGERLEELINELQPTGDLSAPVLTTWTVVVSH